MVAFALEYIAQPAVLRVGVTHARSCVRQILVEARARDTALDLDVRSFRCNRNHPRLKLGLAIHFAFCAERRQIILAVGFLRPALGGSFQRGGSFRRGGIVAVLAFVFACTD